MSVLLPRTNKTPGVGAFLVRAMGTRTRKGERASSAERGMNAASRPARGSHLAELPVRLRDLLVPLLRPLGLLLMLGTLSLDAAPTPETYVVQKGDTCQIIVDRFGPPLTLEVFHQINPEISGPPPHLLKPEQVVRLVPLPPKPEARLTYVRPRVQTTPPNADPMDGKLGQELFSRYRVDTRSRANSEVTFRDDSVVQLYENSTLVIYGGDPYKPQSSGRQIELKEGTLRGGLAALRGSGGAGGNPGTAAAQGSVPALVLKTPSAQVQVNASDLNLEVTRSASNRLSVYEGNATIRSGGAAVAVAENQGTVAEKGKAPLPARALLPAPSWLGEAAPQLLRIQDGPFFSGISWQPVPGAKAYSVEIAAATRDGGASGGRAFRELVERQLVTSTGYLPNELPDGDYLVRVSSRDALGLVGKPSAVLNLEARTWPLARAMSSPTGAVLVDGMFSLPLRDGLVTIEGRRFSVWIEGLRVTESPRLFPRWNASGHPLPYRMSLRAPDAQSTSAAGAGLNLPVYVLPIGLKVVSSPLKVDSKGGTVEYRVAACSNRLTPVALEPDMVTLNFDGGRTLSQVAEPLSPEQAATLCGPTQAKAGANQAGTDPVEGANRGRLLRISVSIPRSAKKRTLKGSLGLAGGDSHLQDISLEQR